MIKIKSIDPALIINGYNVIRAIKNPLRQKIIKYLEDNPRAIVQSIYKSLKEEQSVISSHLGILRKEGFLNTEREGKYIFYSINTERFEKVQGIIKQLIN